MVFLSHCWARSLFQQRLRFRLPIWADSMIEKLNQRESSISPNRYRCIPICIILDENFNNFHSGKLLKMFDYIQNLRLFNQRHYLSGKYFHLLSKLIQIVTCNTLSSQMSDSSLFKFNYPGSYIFW